MAVDTTAVRNDYIGNDSTDTYNYSFKIFSKSELLVVVRNTDNEEEILDVDVDYTVDGVGNPSGGEIVLLAGNLPDDYILTIVYNAPLVQDTSIRNQGAFYPTIHEDTFDKLLKKTQQQQDQIDRSIKLPVTIAASSFSTLLPTNIKDLAEYLLMVNEDGTGFTLINKDAVGGGGTGGSIQIGVPNPPNPTTYDGPLKITDLTFLSDFAYKVDDLFSKLVPVAPDNLVDKILAIIGNYTALRASTGDSDYCTDDTTPTVQVGGYTQTIADGFADADSGTLTAEMDAVSVGSVALTTADETGTYGEMDVIEFDPYAGEGFGKEGIYKALIARINSSALAVGQHLASLIHSITGQADLNFFVDDPTTPSITGVSTGFSGTSSYKSGVPAAAQGQNINVQFDVDDFCGTHYNATRIAGAQSSQTGAQVNAALGGPYSAASTFSANINLPVAASQYSENVSITCRAYNSKGDITSSNVNSGVRVDSVGTETRVLSSTGQYPASGYGGAFNSTTDVLSGNKELQYLNGRFQYPPAVNYTTALPAGPDYSALTPDAHNSMRWVTFSLGSITSASFVQFTLQGAQNITGGAIVSGMEVYLRVDGATPTTGWLNANAAYPGVGNPTANGDAALDVGASTATAKRVTFGAAVKTGTVYVRVGIPSGSNKAFSGVA